MSHFTVLVVLPKDTELEQVQERLGEIMEPWNENTDVEPYREYIEEATPEQHWQYPYVYADALPAADAAPTTWEQYAQAFNEHNEHDAADIHRMQVDEDGRAYTLTTYNPNSKWDYWVIGGRWRNELTAKPTVDRSALHITDEPHWSEGYGNEAPTQRGPAGGLRCNGGRLCDLDLEGMKAEKAAEAEKAYDRYLAAITPELVGETLPWRHFFELSMAGAYDELVAARVAAQPEGTDLADRFNKRDAAREAYKAQPGIQKLNEDEFFRRWFGCPVEEYSLGRDAYIERQTANFMPGYALVTQGGEWKASGEMGWWGMGSDTAGTVDAFKADALAYLRSLDQQSIVVLLDCHI